MSRLAHFVVAAHFAIEPTGVRISRGFKNISVLCLFVVTFLVSFAIHSIAIYIIVCSRWIKGTKLIHYIAGHARNCIIHKHEGKKVSKRTIGSTSLQFVDKQ